MKNAVRRLEDIGEIRKCLWDILDNEVFTKTNKHEPLWDCEDEKQADFLTEIRCGIRSIQLQLDSIMIIINRNYDDYD